MLYGCVIDASDYVVRRDGQAFDWEDYRTNPREYKSVFASRYLPFASVIVNCSYWDDRFPRILQVWSGRVSVCLCGCLPAWMPACVDACLRGLSACRRCCLCVAVSLGPCLRCCPCGCL